MEVTTNNPQYNYMRPGSKGLGTVTYNGITIEYAHATDVVFEAVMDPTGCDVLYYSCVIGVDGIIFRDSNPDVFQTNDVPALVAQKIRHFLTVPRRSFKFVINNPYIPDGGSPSPPITWIQSSPYAQVGKGPMPSKPTFTNLLDGAWQIGWRISVPVIESKPYQASPTPSDTTLLNPISVGTLSGFGTNQDYYPSNPRQSDKRGNATYNPIGSMRWKSTHSIDAKNLSKISYAGRLILRAPLENCNPLEFRAAMTPNCPYGFIRANSTYMITEAGDACDFTFTDEEQQIMPPVGCIKWNGSAAMTFLNSGGKVQGSVSVHLEGNRDISKSALTRQAVSICFDTLRARGLQTVAAPTSDRPATNSNLGFLYKVAGAVLNPVGAFANAIQATPVTLQATNNSGTPGTSRPPAVNRRYFVTGGEIRDSLSENTVDVVMTGLLNRQGAVFGGIPIDYDVFDFQAPAIVDGQGRAVTPTLSGNVPNLQLWAALFNDPTLNRDYRILPPGTKIQSKAVEPSHD